MDFAVALLLGNSGRLVAISDFLVSSPRVRGHDIGLFGASTGAAAALMTEEIKLHHHDDVPAGFQSSASKDKSSKIIITSESEKETLEFFIDDLLYIESADNYSRIFYTKKSKESSIIIRSSLKRIETQANHVDLFRCHRAYIVNLKKIGSVKGNSQGYRLKVNDTEKEIPVSRNSGKELSERLKNLS